MTRDELARSFGYISAFDWDVNKHRFKMPTKFERSIAMYWWDVLPWYKKILFYFA